jgi:acetoacetyl-CoA synthetase
MNTPELLWQPSPERIAQANLTRFVEQVNQRWNAGATDHASLYAWSIREPARFWEAVWDFAGVIGEKVLARSSRTASACPGRSGSRAGG